MNPPCRLCRIYLLPIRNPPCRLCLGRQASIRMRRSGHLGLSYKSLLNFTLSVIGVALQMPHPIIAHSPTYGTSERRPPLAAADHRSIVIPYSLLFCFSASLMCAHNKLRRASGLLQVLGFYSILLTLASLLSNILPPKLWLLPYILFAVFLVCSFLAPLKWLYRRGREVEAFNLVIRRFASAHETPPPTGSENA